MRCEVAEREISASLDDASSRRADRDLERHVSGCRRCGEFEARARQLREVVRLQPAEPVPDLVESIMTEIRRQAAPVSPLRGRGRKRPAWPRYAAAFVAGAVAAAVVAGGLPAVRRAPSPALATEIPRRIAQASREVTAYHATFALMERNFHPRVPRRRLVAEISFEAPERFRADVTDRTTYPPGGWPASDVTLAVDGSRWAVEAPEGCPRLSLPACATGARRATSLEGREPFDGDALLPTDIVVPVRTLAGSNRVRVAGEGTVLGHDVVVVELAYRDAVPLFAFLEAAGTWRPFFPHDRVLVSLESESWFPLAYEVLPAGTPERSRWAHRNGLPEEPPGRAAFRATARSFSTDLPARWRPLAGLPPASRDEGFHDAPLAELDGVVLPGDLAGLRPHRAGTFTAGGRPRDEVLVSFTRGLGWLKMRQTRQWAERELFGDVGDLAAPVRLPGGGTAYYEPATANLGRRLSIHAGDIDVYLETNLPRETLLRVASSLPVEGGALPDRWLVRRLPGGTLQKQVDVDTARDALPGLLLPGELPPGYALWTIHLAEVRGVTAVTAFFRRSGAEFDGVGIRLHQAEGTGLAPPLEEEPLAVRVRGRPGRYSPARGELEWIEDGIYRSLGGTALDLGGLLEVAASLEDAR